MARTNLRARLSPGGEISFPGIDYSNRRPLRVVARAVNAPYIAVKHPGGSCWGGVGADRVQVAAYFMVFKVCAEAAGELELEPLLEIPLREPKPTPPQGARR